MLRAHLAERLPEYMVPAAYVRLEALPLTPNGKVDRKALPAPEGDAFAARGYEAPCGEAEQAVAAIWAELLGAERVGRRDHFFELGGHSLLAVRVVSRVRQALGVEASPGDLFERPVLADFARGLETAARAEATAIAPVDRTGAIPLSFAQQRLWFLEQLGNLGGTYHIPMRLRLRGDAGPRRAGAGAGPHRRAARGAADDLPGGGRRAGAAHRPGRGERVPPGGARSPRVAPDAEDELRRLVSGRGGRAVRPGARAAGPRAPGAHGGGRPRAAADDAPHRLRRLVDRACSSASWARCTPPSRAASADPLPPLPVQYADYAAWHRRWWRATSWRRRRSTGRETLAGAPELLELPTDRPRPARQDFAGASLHVELDEALTGGAARRCRSGTARRCS